MNLNINSAATLDNPSVRAFNLWLAKAHPNAYVKLAVSYPSLFVADPSLYSSGMAGLGGATTATPAPQPWYAQAINAITSAVPLYFGVKQENAMVSLNLQRAAQGLPPIDTSSYAPQVNFGVSPQITSMATWVAIGAFALVAIALLSRKKSNG